MEKAKVKKLLGISYRIFELIVVLYVTVLIFAVRYSLNITHDRVEYTDTWEMVLIAMAWLFFVSVPLLIVYIVSFFRSLSFRTVLHKIIFGGHILNIVLWFLFYFMLPKAEPITAAMMENHYLSHQHEMRDLIEYTRSCLEDSTGIVFEMRNGELLVSNVYPLWEAGDDIWDNENESQRDSVLSSVGITKVEFDTIQTKMKAAGVIGINTQRKGYMPESYLSYAWYGYSNYVYVLYGSKEEDNEYKRLDDLWLNDSVSFVNMRNMIGHTFPDRDEFLKKHPQK